MDTAQAVRVYHKQHRTATSNALTKKKCPMSIAMSSKIADHLDDLLRQMTIGLWDAHDDKDRARKAKARSKVSKEKFAARKKNEEMQTQIAKAEKEDHEAKERGEIPPSMATAMKKYATAEVKKQFAALKKKERVKGSGGGKDQPSTPTENGQKQRGRSTQAGGRSPRSSSRSSTKQQGGQSKKSARKNNRKKRSTSKESSSRTSTSASKSKDSQRGRSPKAHGGRGRGGRGGRGGRHNARGRGRGQRR